MRRRDLVRRLVLLLLVLLLGGRAEAEGAFIIGIAPHTSARAILEQYGPLRGWLEQQLARPVEIQTARDFSIFADRALQQSYDLVITTGHQARLIQEDAGYLPLATYRSAFKAIVVTGRDMPVTGPADLADRLVIGLSETSLVTLWGLDWLRQNQSAALVKFVSAADSVADLLISERAVAGFMSTANFAALSEAVRARLRIVASSQAMLGRVYLLNGRNAAAFNQVKTALFAFEQSPVGMRYFMQTRLGGYRDVAAAELDYMEPFAGEVRRALMKKSP